MSGILLQRAAWAGRLKVGQYLLYHGADICARNHQRNISLTSAVYRGHVEFARMLLERGAVIDARDNDGMSGLYFAIERETENTHALQLLPELGTDVNVVTGEKTPQAVQ